MKTATRPRVLELEAVIGTGNDPDLPVVRGGRFQGLAQRRHVVAWDDVLILLPEDGQHGTGTEAKS